MPHVLSVLFSDDALVTNEKPKNLNPSDDELRDQKKTSISAKAKLFWIWNLLDFWHEAVANRSRKCAIVRTRVRKNPVYLASIQQGVFSGFAVQLDDERGRERQKYQLRLSAAVFNFSMLFTFFTCSGTV